MYKLNLSKIIESLYLGILTDQQSHKPV